MGLNARKAEKYANLSTSIIEWAEELNKLSTQLNIGNLAHVIYSFFTLCDLMANIVITIHNEHI